MFTSLRRNETPPPTSPETGPETPNVLEIEQEDNLNSFRKLKEFWFKLQVELEQTL